MLYLVKCNLPWHPRFPLFSRSVTFLSGLNLVRHRRCRWSRKPDLLEAYLFGIKRKLKFHHFRIMKSLKTFRKKLFLIFIEVWLRNAQRNALSGLCNLCVRGNTVLDFLIVLCLTCISKRRALGMRWKGKKDSDEKRKPKRWTVGGHVRIATRLTLGSSIWSNQAAGHFQVWAVPASAILTLSYWKGTLFSSHSAKGFIIY